MRAALFLLLIGCSYNPAGVTTIEPDARPDGLVTPIDSPPVCGWSYTPSNFDPCTLPPAGTFAGAAMIDTDSLGALPNMSIVQTNNVSIAVVHLSSLDLQTALIIKGSQPLVLAVEGAVTVGTVTVLIGAGRDDVASCANLVGAPGASSQASQSGGGGGAGGAGIGNGAAGFHGDNNGGGAGNEGAGGAQKTGLADDLVPLRAGCNGGAGGTDNGTGTPGNGGPGGGGIQISSNVSIDIAGLIEASGRGGEGIPTQQTGGGGGGGGGAILLEAPNVHLSGRLCADGGGGANGGGASAPGASGVNSPCSGTGPAIGKDLGNNGGAGGDGGYRNSLNGAPGEFAAGGGGGGGGGGGAGWIRIIGTLATDAGFVITPGQ